MIEVEHITKVYRMGETEVRALDDVSLCIQGGEMVAIMGPSGSGKSTLLAILGCLDMPTQGIYRLEGQTVERLTEDRLAEIRGRRIGFVFQQFNLLPRTTALENVMLPLLYNGHRGREREAKARQALEIVGLADHWRRHPNQLSGGEQQRVAIARALVNEPAILLADEPTGNLDSKTGMEIIALFQRLNREFSKTIVYVTHDTFVARHTSRVLYLKDGQVVREEKIKEPLIAGQEEWQS